MVSRVTGTITAEQQKKLDQIDAKNKTDELKKNQEMGREQFLKVLMTQLSHQNPLSPLEDKDFIAQMAQFTSVESMQAMVEGLDDVKKEVSSIKASIAEKENDDKTKKTDEADKAEKTELSEREKLVEEANKLMEILNENELKELNNSLTEAIKVSVKKSLAKEAYGE